MADKSKKVDKEFVLSDSSVNCYGFRLLTEGYQLAQFQRNPIGYHMHNRDAGVVVKWEDLKVSGDQVLGKPVINLSNPKGQQCLDEVEAGFLNAASVGHIIVLEYSMDPKLMLEGQTGPTITKWYNNECSLVDIPGNANALTSLLYDEAGNGLQVADLMAAGGNKLKFNKSDMQQLTLSLSDLTALKDAGFEVSDFAGLMAKVKGLQAEAAKVSDLAAQVTTLKNEKADLSVKMDLLKAGQSQKEIDQMLDVALKAGKVTKEILPQLKDLYGGRPELLKKDLDSRPPYKPLANNLQAETEAGEGEYGEFQKLSWDEMHKTPGKLPQLKAKFPDLYREKFKSKYKVYPSAD